EDTRRALVPSDDDFAELKPIGTAVDLSATENVYQPIPGHEMTSSETPLPAYWLLTHRGLLVGWWVVYDESIEKKTIYSGMNIANGVQNPTSPEATKQSRELPNALAGGGGATGTSLF